MCLACADVDRGLRMRTVAGAGLTTTSSFTVTEHHRGAPGFAHGGLLALAFDEAFATVCVLLMDRVVTGELTVTYRRPVEVGSEVHIASGIDGQSGRKVFVSGRATLSTLDGPVVAEARAVCLLRG